MLNDNTIFGINRLPYFLQFLYLCGLFGVGMLVLLLFTWIIFSSLGLGMDFMQNIDPANLTGKEINALKLAQFAQLAIFIIPALAFSWLKTGSWSDYWGTKGDLNSRAMLMMVLMTFFCLPVVLLLGYWNQGLSLPDTEFFREIETWMRASEEQAMELTAAFLKMDSIVDLLIALFLVAVLAALGEELFFRGTIQPFLEEWTKNGHVAIIITAFAFSFFHFQFYGFLPRFVLGIFLGYLLLWSRNIWYPIIAHFVYNGMQVIAAYYSPDIATSEPELPDNWLVTVAPGAVLSTVLLIGATYAFFHHFNPKRKQVS